MAPHFNIPGSFEPHTPSGVHPNVFRPPAAAAAPSPSANSYLFAAAAPSEPTHAHAKRKRDETRENTPVRDPGGGRSYVLAGQIETPGPFDAGGGAGDGMAESAHSDVAYRRRLAPGRRLGGDNSGARGGEGWSRAALGAIGGMVGKVWEFCKGGGFQGFYAGGGRGFEMDAGSSSAGGGAATAAAFAGGFPAAQRTDVGGAGRGFETAAAGRRLESADAGAHFQPAFGADFGGLGRPLSLNTSSGPVFGTDLGSGRGSPDSATPSRPPAKRRQLKNDELGRNWVIVDEPAHHHRRSSTRPSPARPASAFGGRTRNSSQIPTSVATGRRINASTPRPATAAGHYPAPDNNTNNYNNFGYNSINKTPSSTRAKRVSHAGSPALSAREPASFAGQRSPLSPPPPPSRPSPSAGFSPSQSRIPLSSGRVAHRRRTDSAATSPVPEGGGRARTGSLSDLALSGARPPSSGAPANGAGLGLGQGPGAGAGKGSPRLDPEARELAARRVKEERDADVRIAAFNSRLRDMIREGREALGTSVDVEGDAWMDE